MLRAKCSLADLVYFIQALHAGEGNNQAQALKYKQGCKSIRTETEMYKKLRENEATPNFISMKFLCETIGQPEPFLALEFCKGKHLHNKAFQPK